MTLDERKIYAEKLADKLPALRKELGVSQQDLSDKAGLAEVQLQKWRASGSYLPEVHSFTDDVNDFLSGKNTEGLQ